MKRIVAAAAFIAAVTVSCRQQGGDSKLLTRPFPVVQVPAMVTEPSERMDYVASHYWNRFPDTTGVYLSDSTHILGIENGDMEQAIANYTSILESIPVDRMRKYVGDFYEKIAQLEARNPEDSTFEATVRIFDRYLYDPNSPVRNEEIYLPFCEKMAVSELISAEKRDIYERARQCCSLNRIGAVAADFSFSDRYGKTRTLHSIKADYTLLFFSNPGCHACKDIIDNLSTLPQIQGLITSGKLAVVNVYIDEDTAAWYEYMPIYPESWYNGYDPNLIIRSDELYSVRAIPSLYILDAQKRVIMKDAPENKALQYLVQLGESL